MSRPNFVFALGAIFLSLSFPCEAQQPPKVPRIGYLDGTSPSAVSTRVEAFRQGLRDLGYIEGKNIVIEYRYAEGKLDRLPDLAAELVNLKVNIIVTGATDSVQAAKKASKTIPIYPRGDFAESGGLMSYGADRAEPYQRVAVMVDKILKGTKPADIPVEQPKKFEFVINLKAAKQIGLTIPQSVLYRADKVIK